MDDLGNIRNVSFHIEFFVKYHKVRWLWPQGPKISLTCFYGSELKTLVVMQNDYDLTINHVWLLFLLNLDPASYAPIAIYK